MACCQAGETSLSLWDNPQRAASATGLGAASRPGGFWGHDAAPRVGNSTRYGCFPALHGVGDLLGACARPTVGVAMRQTCTQPLPGATAATEIEGAEMLQGIGGVHEPPRKGLGGVRVPAAPAPRPEEILASMARRSSATVWPLESGSAKGNILAWHGGSSAANNCGCSSEVSAGERKSSSAASTAGAVCRTRDAGSTSPPLLATAKAWPSAGRWASPPRNAKLEDKAPTAEVCC